MTEHKKTPVKSHGCPACGYIMDTVSNVSENNNTPKKGDVTVCLNCGDVLQFKKDLTVEPIGKGVMGKIIEATPNAYVHLQRASNFIKKRGFLNKKNNE